MKSSVPIFPFNHINLNTQKKKSLRIKAIAEIINSGVFFNGIQTEELTRHLSNYLRSGYVTTCGSGHDALVMALSSLDLKDDDEIIFPVNVYPTAFPVSLSKGKPIPVDVTENGQIDPDEVAKKLTKKTKAIIMVHLYGMVGDLYKIKEMIKGRGIILIEDCAQAFGTLYENEPVGTFGDISCFSFYPTKNLSTLGDGGALWTKNRRFFSYFLKAKSYGEKERYISQFVSFHSRIPEIQAGIINLYFQWVHDDLQKRRKAEEYYKKAIQKAKLNRYIRVLESHPQSNPSLHLFVVECDSRDKLKGFLDKHSIHTFIHYPYPIHLVPAFSYLGYKKGDFPIAERLSQNIISLPFYPGLSKQAVKYILAIIQKFYCG